MTRLRLARLLCALLLVSLTACGGLELKRVNSAQSKPNNVWVFFTVRDSDGEPVGGLEASDFTVYENGESVSVESQHVILNPEVAAVMYTLLLVDMSGSVTDSGQVDSLITAAKGFSEKLSKSQKVGVYAFDGGEKLYPIVKFSDDPKQVERGLDQLESFKPKDRSTNLHGAVVEGLAELKTQLDKEKKPLKFGTLVVFTDGTDQAARVSRQQMRDAMANDDYKHYEMYAIGVGSELAESELKYIGKHGMELASDMGKVQEAFNKLADRLEAHTKRFYLLSYCTPKRAGSHEVRVEARRKKEGSEASGDLEYTFTADGFGPPPDCNPERAPEFDVTQPDEDGDVEPKPGSPTKPK